MLLNEAGFYYVQTHSEKGCEVFDSLKLIVSDNALQADFLLASEAEMGNTVVIIEITYPIAESLVWNFPPEANQIAAHDNYQEIMFSDTGRYYIELTAAAGNCTSTKGKYIEIYDPNDSKKNQAIEAEPSQIQKFEVYPNPATYHLNLSIDLADEKDIVIELIDATGNKLTKVNYTNGLKNYEVTLDVNSLKQGVYMVRLLSGNDVRSKMIVIY